MIKKILYRTFLLLGLGYVVYSAHQVYVSSVEMGGPEPGCDALLVLCVGLFALFCIGVLIEQVDVRISRR
ncbi:MAG: hypothetical protein H6760_04080 [Candidatus Nomurabacteria bacterium]|nr:MAG: hypothetical protein H6760_04080 [Candidatus Nomurabacteria bacterium]